MIQVEVLGTSITGVTLEEAVNLLDKCVVAKADSYVCFCEAHLNVQGLIDPFARNALDHAAYVFPDGVSMTLGARIGGKSLPARLSGPDIMLAYMQHGVSSGRRHYLLGGGEGVAEQVKRRLEDEVTGISIVGTFTPPFREMTEEEMGSLKQQMNELNVNVLWVALGAPKQELWMHNNAAFLEVPLMLGVGAAFDFHAGVRKRAPSWIRAIGFEWLYRMFTGGRRVFFRNLRFESAFVYYILKDWVMRQFGKIRLPRR